ncbi:MAG: hypothetical protein K2Y37_01280 [Pirellulales bacterium]|nr:hypothetical protein [Pirellulales bacterium]
MEALTPEVAGAANAGKCLPNTTGGYVNQADLRSLIAEALRLGFTLIAYDPDFWTWREPSCAFECAKQRDRMQASNLASAWRQDAKMLVWAGNLHIAKAPLKTPNGPYPQMAYWFRNLTEIEPFCIDQTVTVDWAHGNDRGSQHVARFRTELHGYGGTAGFLREEGPDPFQQEIYADAFLLSLHNAMTVTAPVA